MATQFWTTEFSRQGLANRFRKTRNAVQSTARGGAESRQRRRAESAVHHAITGPAVFAIGSNQPEIRQNEITARQRHS